MPYYENGPFLVWYDPDKPGPRPRIMTPHGLLTVRHTDRRRVIQPFPNSTPTPRGRRSGPPERS